MFRSIRALLAIAFTTTSLLFCQSTPQDHVIVSAGVPLHIALDQRASYAKPGSLLVGHLTVPVYVGETVALPVGTKVRGKVVETHSVSKQKRFDAIAAGDVTPLKDAVAEFYSITTQDGKVVAIQSSATNRDTQLVLLGSAEKNEGLWKRVKDQARGRLSEEKKSLSEEVRRPHKLERLKYAMLARLPYHPQAFDEGAKFVAELTAPIVVSLPGARLEKSQSKEEVPASGTVLHARLISALDSSSNHWGDKVEAVLTEPVYGTRHELLLPEGAHLFGHVTHAEAAKRWARNGQLSFAFNTLQMSSGAQRTMTGRLNAVEGDKNSNVELDEEGNAKAKPPKAGKLIPLATVMLAQFGSDDGESDSRGHGGMAAGGLGLTGRVLALSSASRYVAYGIGYFGAAKSIYAGFIGRGKDVVFPKDTQLEIRMDVR